jgi:hypothetical protein
MTKPIKVDPKSHISPFEQIRHLDPVTGEEYWSSREFAVVLGYADYDWFKKVIEKAEQACFNSGHEIEDHFRGSSEMVALGSGAKRSVKTVHMSRYACYLAIQNADPQKEIVALGQTYFAVQTRRQEVADQQLLEGDRRVLLRAELRNHNSKLADAAKAAGVVEPIDYAIFQNHGYKGLYNGLDQAAIHRRKGDLIRNVRSAEPGRGFINSKRAASNGCGGRRSGICGARHHNFRAACLRAAYTARPLVGSGNGAWVLRYITRFPFPATSTRNRAT